MSWLKQPQKGQRVSNTEPNCMSSCSIHRREPTFDAILGKGSPLRPHPVRKVEAGMRHATSGLGVSPPPLPSGNKAVAL